VNNNPTVLGINRTQDASICLIRHPSTIYSIQKERLTRQKHHWGKPGDLREIYAKRMPELSEPIDVVVECFSSDPEIKNIKLYNAEIDETLTFRNAPVKLRISHHLAHLYSCFHLSPFNQAAVMIIDCAGSPARDFTEAVRRNGFAPDMVEVSSFYRCSEDGVECLSKQLWDVDWKRPTGLGCFYHLLTRVIFPGEGNEGKVMGLAPYGDPAALGLPPLTVRGGEVLIPEEWLAIFQIRDRFRYFQDGSGSFDECATLAAAGQHCFEEALLALADWFSHTTGEKNLCFAGGTALNCVANGRLLRESAFQNVFIPPSPHDGGTSVGCAIYGLTEHLGLRDKYEWVNDFLGLEPSGDSVDKLLKDDPDVVIERPDNLIDTMADLIVSGRVVSLFQGRSELGPRALGHRSILADPRNPRIRQWINENVKGRETFRPLAPAALLEAAPRFFEIDRPVPFMQFAAAVRGDARELIPAVTHVDGTARLQTVSEHEDRFFHALIKAFEDRTGIGVLLNTSFNGKAEPIVETYAEAIRCFKSTAIHALAVPPFLICKVNEPEIVAMN
jgi:carbamoyltransferase